ncbi:MAG: peptidoglycan editing factor PgeF [Sulfuricurvum sp.]|jgi:hypothetical protein|uniref:peptidoglycan editing factor PgeF n=1 Tax=Sulfuricurvum sp. TaxID=2025608 RepID=UPI0025F4236D|nr:peptidoglycan editing factor PgeF [Sulfuricurvum sp.]MCK9373520.1 peptidoglycan editing factor PgeF [Sulfuricurvum sp.]
MKTISSPLLSLFSDITALFTTRHGGVSKPPFTTANLAFHVGDDPRDVLDNHDMLAKFSGYDRTKLIHMRQIHSDRIVLIDERINFDTPPECDALITNRPYTPLMVMSADCTPILVYDPVQRVIGAIHAGRAGALNAILPKTIERMGETFGSKIEDIRISMGPSIHGCCYEINGQIGAEVKEKGYSEALRKEGERLFLDVNTVLRQQLDALNLPQEHLEVIAACPACKSDTYFSYRADRQHTGRIAGVIFLR